MNGEISTTSKVAPQTYGCDIKTGQSTHIHNGEIKFANAFGCLIDSGPYVIVVSPEPYDDSLTIIFGIATHNSFKSLYSSAVVHHDYGVPYGPGRYHKASGRVIEYDYNVNDDITSIYVYSDITSAIDPHSFNGQIVDYDYKINGEGAIYKDISPFVNTDVLLSEDGKYIFFVGRKSSISSDTWLRKINTETMTVDDILLDNANESIHLRTVSDDGRYIYGHSVKNISYGSEYYVYDTQSCNPICSKRVMDVPLDDLRVGLGYNVIKARFTGEDTLLIVIANPKPNDTYVSEVSLRAETTYMEGFDYLALGDSFSSGEGDIGVDPITNKNYYREHTDDDGYAFVDEVRNKVRPTEQCHIGTRSYPYKIASGIELGKHWDGASGAWGSVACSGALMSDIDSTSKDSYSGQTAGDTGKPRLQGYDSASKKAEALNEMIPGRAKQIEFVKKYKPKAVTLTAGGNDVQFERILRACVQPNIFMGGEWTSTCSYAKDDEKKANIANEIINLRPKLINLYNEIIEAGNNDMKLYVLGYPLFVDDQRAQNNFILENIATCGANVRLNYQERQMVAESTKYLNKIIQSAANEAGAIYISTTDALGSHKLCGEDSNKAVNGIVGSDSAESFHPNKFGQALLAERVLGATEDGSLLNYNCKTEGYVTCPGGEPMDVSVPDYFKIAIANNTKTRLDDQMTESILSKIGKTMLTIVDYTLLFNNPITVMLYSDKTELGTFTTNSRGGITGEIMLPENIKPGYHTLEVEATDIDGEPIKLWKIVEIRSGDPNDYDGDGVPNDQDYCTYIEPAGLDVDKDGTDDGCDPEVTGGAISSPTYVGSTNGSSFAVGDKSNITPEVNTGRLYVDTRKGLIDQWSTIREEASMANLDRPSSSSNMVWFASLIVLVSCMMTAGAILIRKKR